MVLEQIETVNLSFASVESNLPTSNKNSWWIWLLGAAIFCIGIYLYRVSQKKKASEQKDA